MTSLQLAVASNTGVVKVCSIDLQKNVKRLLHTWGTPDLLNEVDAMCWGDEENTQVSLILLLLIFASRSTPIKFD
jgi:hypothetical protein